MVHKTGNRYLREFKQQIVKWIKLYSLLIDEDDGSSISVKDYRALQKRLLN